jgi:hypothetical protein
MLTVIARVLVTEEGIGESADIIWRQLQTEHHIIVAPTAFDPLPAPSIEHVPTTIPLLPPVPTGQAVVTTLRFGARPPEGRAAARTNLLRHTNSFRCSEESNPTPPSSDAEYIRKLLAGTNSSTALRPTPDYDVRPFPALLQKSRNEVGSEGCREGRPDRWHPPGDSRSPRKRSGSSIPLSACTSCGARSRPSAWWERTCSGSTPSSRAIRVQHDIWRREDDVFLTSRDWWWKNTRT